ncbi:MAG: hypothetical protein MPK75_08350, partial [Alphaproteobacteria bacterium]|nr:hypothetical protein [Alphaproteobacteria bacterium]
SMKPLDPRRLHRSPRTASGGLHHQKSGRAEGARRVRLRRTRTLRRRGLKSARRVRRKRRTL